MGTKHEEGSGRMRATLVLDMRGTLMSQVTRPQMSPELEEYAVEVPAVNGPSDSALVVLKRPHVDCFLDRMAALFEVIAFTSCGQRMADKVFDVLDPAGTRFSRRLYAGSCKQFGVKDLSVLGRPMGQVIIIDDSYKKCILNPDNWIPISTFKRNPDDRELLELEPFLERLAEVEDVRPVIRESFGHRVETLKLLFMPGPLEELPVEHKKMKGHQVEGSGRINALGRLLTKILRHRAIELGLELRSDGFCRVSDLLRLDLKTRSKVPLSSHTVAEVLDAVQLNTKQRLSTMVDDSGELYIRACQGHTIKEVACPSLLREITSADQAPVCVHGTRKEVLPNILREGLRVMGRNHMHFATGLPEAGVTSGIRTTSEVIIFLDVKKAMEDNMKLFLSDNHVVLTEGFEGVVPCCYFEKVVEWPSNRPLV